MPECKASMWKDKLKRHVPFFKWISAYRKSDFVADMIAGVTLGLTLIPQSVAYAALAGVSAEYGLYSSFMGGFTYVFFGTVKEVSVGPTSLISLLTFEFTRDLPLSFVFLFTFMCGCIEFLCGLLQFGFLVNFISRPVTISFQSATSLIIVASQLKDFFGLPKFKSGRFIENVYNVIERIPQSNLGDVTLSVCCCIFLLSLRKLNDLKTVREKGGKSKGKLLEKGIWFISISRNALCVFISCIVAYVFTEGEKRPFKLSGNIPSGLPPFRLPFLPIEVQNQTLTFPEMIYEIAPGLVVVPLISILANVTIAKAFAAGLPVDATQEMLTLGLCNIGGSFVGSLPTCGAFTRSAVSNSSGVRTPLSGLFTGTLIILVIKYLTPYFYYIPRATLASVLICAVIFMIDLKTIFGLWKANKRDFFCAAITFSTSLLIGIQIGLALGIAWSLCHLLYMWARPSIHVDIRETTNGKYYLVTPDIGLFFPGNDFVRNKITRFCTQNIPIVINCLHFKGIDYTVAQGIKDLSDYYKMKNQKLILINMSLDIYLILKNSKMELNLSENITEEDMENVLFEFGKAELPFVILRHHENPSVSTNQIKLISEEKSLIKK